jgi:uncharacterized membrane protein
MLFLFVALIHIPNVVHNPGDRFAWAVATRDFGFALGAWTLAATQFAQFGAPNAHRIISLCRILFAMILIFFAFEHLTHPEFTPGVPLPQQMPQWIPLRAAWGYVVGIALLISGLSLLIDKYARAATTCLGVVVSLVVLLINTPTLAVAAQVSDVITGLNYVADTMLFAGTIFLIARAIPVKSAVPQLVQEAASSTAS